MTVDLDALEALARAALPGNWHYTREHGIETTQAANNGDLYGSLCWEPQHESDGDVERGDAQGRYIAAASPDVVLALIAHIRQVATERAAGNPDYQPAWTRK